MALVNAPNKNTDREGAIEFLMATQPHLRSRAKAEAVLSRGNQYADFVADYERGLRKQLIEQDVIGVLSNYKDLVDNQDQLADVDENRLRRERAAILDKYQGKLDWLENQDMSDLTKLVEKGWVGGEAIEAYNRFVELGKVIEPELKARTLDVPGTTTNESVLGRVDSSQTSTSAVDPSTFTGWARDVYEKAKASGQDPSELAPSFVAGNSVHEATLNKVKAALRTERGTTSTGEQRATTVTNVDPSTFTGWVKNVYQQALRTGQDPSELAPSFVAGNAVHEASLEKIRAALGFQGGTGTADGTVTGAAGVSDSTADSRAQAIQDAIDYINSQDLPADVKAVYLAAVQNWDPDQELNVDNIISTFNKIKDETIDPRFRGLTNLAIAQLQDAKTAINAQRAVELETEALNRSEAIRGARSGLEAAGLTFSGEAVRQLGAESAFSTAPGRIPFGGTEVPEGLIEQSSRLISTSSEAAFEKNLADLARAAEQTLGTEKTGGLGFATVGSVTGSLVEEQQSVEGSTLGNLLNQQRANVAQDQDLDFT